MRIEELQRKLFKAARALPPSDAVPYAFEARVMARLAAPSAVDAWALWSRLLWRAAAPCVGIMVVMSIWSILSTSSMNPSETLAADLERTVWEPLASLGDSW